MWRLGVGGQIFEISSGSSWRWSSPASYSGGRGGAVGSCSSPASPSIRSPRALLFRCLGAATEEGCWASSASSRGGSGAGSTARARSISAATPAAWCLLLPLLPWPAVAAREGAVLAGKNRGDCGRWGYGGASSTGVMHRRPLCGGVGHPASAFDGRKAALHGQATAADLLPPGLRHKGRIFLNHGGGSMAAAAPSGLFLWRPDPTVIQ